MEEKIKTLANVTPPKWKETEAKDNLNLLLVEQENIKSQIY